VTTASPGVEMFILGERPRRGHSDYSGTESVVADQSTSQTDLLNRLSRIEGQVRGIARMVEQGKYCIDILTQVSAASRALQSVALGLLDSHLSHCVVDAARTGGAEQDVKLEEASAAIARLVRS
jgi:DNA-binding FrmR family transcriptional regulator